MMKEKGDYYTKKSKILRELLLLIQDEKIKKDELEKEILTLELKTGFSTNFFKRKIKEWQENGFIKEIL